MIRPSDSIPTWPSPTPAGGLTYDILGEHRRAIEDYDTAISLDPSDAIAYTSRGLAYTNLGEFRRAIEDYDTAISLDPNDTIAYRNKGEAYDTLGEHRRAIRDYDTAISPRPQRCRRLHQQGDCLRQPRRAPPGHKGLRHGHQSRPQTTPTPTPAGGLPTPTSASFPPGHRETTTRPSVSTPTTTIAYYNRGLAYTNLGESHRAIEDYDTAIRLDPNDADAYTGRGGAYANLGEHRRAIEDFDMAIRLDLDYAIAYYNRGLVLHQPGRVPPGP